MRTGEQKPGNSDSDKPTGEGITGQPAVRRQGRRWRRILIGGLLAMGLFIALAPQILSQTVLRHELPRLRLRGFVQPIRVGRASLTWGGPIELWDVELDAPDGEPFVKIKKITENRGVWAILFRRNEPVHIRLEQPVVTVLLRSAGSNVEDALAPVLAHPQQSQRKRSFEVVDGALNAIDTSTGRTAKWRAIGLEVATDRPRSAPHRAQLAATLVDAPQAEPLAVDFTWSSAAQAAGTPLGPWEARIKTGNLPLAALSPLFSRAASDLDVSGTVSGDLQLTSRGEKISGAARPLDGKWQLTTKDLMIVCPSLLHDDRLALGDTRFQGKVSSDAASCRVDRFELIAGIGRVDGQGTFAIGRSGTPRDRAADEGRPHEPNFEVRGELDLVRLARLLPHTLPMREGAALTEGKVSLAVASQVQEGRTGWKCRVDTTRLVAQIGQETVAWDQPLNLRIDLHREQDRVQIDALECRSDVVELSGRGNSDRGQIEGHCDLDRLVERLGKFFDTDAHEIHGRVRIAVNWQGDSAGWPVVAVQGDVENLLIRKLTTKTVERRRGEVEPIAIETPAIAPPAPAGSPRDRNERLAQRRAERETKIAALRREKDARRLSQETESSRVTEWKTIWSEPRLKLLGKGRFIGDKKLIEVLQLEAISDGMHLTASGQLTEVWERPEIDLHGEIECNWQRLSERLKKSWGPYLEIVGNESRRFSIRGPLTAKRAPATAVPIVPPQMQGEAGAAWQSSALFGLQTGPGEVRLALAQGIVTLAPFELEISSGKLKLAGQLLLNEGPARVIVPAGRVIENMELTREVCNAWLKFIAPVLSEATRIEGRFSLDLDATQIRLDDPAARALSGRMTIASGEVFPGPVFAEISDMIGQIVSLIDGNPARDLLGLEKPLIRIEQQTVEFKLEHQRVYHSPLEMHLRNVVIRTKGSVGVDQTLAIVAEIAFSDELISQAKFLGPLKGRILEIPIQGTLRKPKIDASVIRRLAAQFGQNAVEGIINKGLRKLFE